MKQHAVLSALAAGLLSVGCVGQVGSGGTRGSRPEGSARDNKPGSGPGGADHPPPAGGARDPGRTTMRRLNQHEYDNTVRDLLGTSQRPGRSTFNSDSPAIGFDNNGDKLILSPVQVDLYRRTAETLAEEALRPPARAGVLPCNPAEGEPCLRRFVSEFGERAYRRPLAPEEVTAYLQLAGKARAAGAVGDEVVRTLLEAMLLSPHFLFKVEVDPDPTSPVAHPVAPHELAARLSYAIYNSMPDPALFAAAKTNRLGDVKELETQLARMLADPKGRTFAASFSEQWLGIRALDVSQLDPALFRLDPAIVGSMQREAHLFFDEFVRENRALPELFTAGFTYLDDPLAKHYGLPPVGAGMKRILLTTPQRGGLLAMAAPLRATARGNRSSPVVRGRWAFAELLCFETPEPPPNVPQPSDEQVAKAPTQREFLKQHRSDPVCNGCHQYIDPVGLALENYDAVGAWRDEDKGTPIDASGEFHNGKEFVKFNGARELAALLARDARFADCLTERLMTYSLGRTLAHTDEPYRADILERLRASGGGTRDLLLGVISSDPFRKRRGEPTDGKGASP
jgi:hypothetical protein